LRRVYGPSSLTSREADRAKGRPRQRGRRRSNARSEARRSRRHLGPRDPLPKGETNMSQSEVLAPIDDDDRIVHVSNSAVGAIVKSEVEAQLDAAHKYPRSLTRFLREAVSLATISQDVAES